MEIWKRENYLEVENTEMRGIKDKVEPELRKKGVKR
jgi:hypothetical protein